MSSHLLVVILYDFVIFFFNKKTPTQKTYPGLGGPGSRHPSPWSRLANTHREPHGAEAAFPSGKRRKRPEMGGANGSDRTVAAPVGSWVGGWGWRLALNHSKCVIMYDNI